jgi:hypothetical protein
MGRWRIGATAMAGWLAVTALTGLGRKRMHTWGSTEEERMRRMAGDAWVEHPMYVTNMAVTINASPADVWPWLAQLGYQRGGLYSYDWLDQRFGFLDRPSARTILAEFQGLQEGDIIPIGRGGGFPVRLVEPGHTLVLAGEVDGTTWSWEFGLYPRSGGGTRLVSRTRGRLPSSPKGWLMLALLEPAAFIMTRRMLLNLKGRAEALAHERGHEGAVEEATAAVPSRDGEVPA